MNQTFSRRRDRLLTYRAMREGKITSSRRTRCSACGEESPQLEWDRNLQVCPRCGFHAPVGAYYRLSNILDPGSFQELEEKLSAPVEEGQQVGRMVVTSGGEVLSELPLVADRPVARLTYWQILERCLQAAFMGG